MSAFIVSTETMQRVVNAIEDFSQGAHVWAEMPTFSASDLDKVGRALFQMNAAALDARYGKDAVYVPKFTYRLIEATSAERFKAVACLRYQCSEGAVPETPLFKALDHLRRHLAIAIANKASATAPWDWPERSEVA